MAVIFLQVFGWSSDAKVRHAVQINAATRLARNARVVMMSQTQTTIGNIVGAFPDGTARSVVARDLSIGGGKQPWKSNLVFLISV